MLYWTWRQWLSQPTRNALAAVVFGAVIALCLLFEGIRYGVFQDLRAFPAGLPADLVLVERGHPYLGLSYSSLPQPSRVEAESVPAVRTAHPLVLLPIVLDAGGRSSPAVIVAYDTMGGPSGLAAGRDVENPDEVVVDAALARRHGILPGDHIVLVDSTFTVSGLSSGSVSPFAPFMFISYDGLIDMLMASDLSVGIGDMSLLSALLIESGDASAELRQALEAIVPESRAYTPEELGDALVSFGQRMIGPVLLLMTGIAWLIGILTMSLLRFAQVRHQLREHGIQLALGARPVSLAIALLGGGLLTAAAAIPLSALFAQGLATLTIAWNPLYVPRVWAPEVLARSAFGLLVATLIGSLLPLQRLLRMDPARVFAQ